MKKSKELTVPKATEGEYIGQWEASPMGHNSCLQAPDKSFFVSFNPSTGSMGVAMFAGDTPQETALVGEDGYLILNGDWRAEYAQLIDQGYEKCREFYLSKASEYKSTWSDDYESN